MEQLKWKFFHRLFDSSRPRIKLDPVINAMEELEEEARGCYWGKIQLSSENFVKMMLIDGCFIVELFKELEQHNFIYAPSIQRWMLPTLRRDLIMLENQLPLFVLQKLFELTSSPEESSTSLQDLTHQFFNPLLQRDSNSALQCINKEAKGKRHFLDLFRSSILPRCSDTEETNNRKDSSITANKGLIAGEVNETIRSVIKLKEAGFIIEKGKNRPPLDVRSEGRVLQIPPLYIDDHKGTVFRNMVAFEQCHHKCTPDVTSYLFFFDELINSAEDVELLHREEVIQHSIGNNKEVAKLVNSLCKEITRNADQSYLHKVVSEANQYYDTYYAKIRAQLVYHYFSSWKVGISTVAGIIALFLNYGSKFKQSVRAVTEPGFEMNGG
ncbi:hypothetical protein SLEP1_g34258 [Rubroshorea leprosula]|uniref:Uncharacterized protein n=1 Tax=Rubroshorea leprosula TaxID=152421 RepID=A0AAV5KJH3_9ROSI|nr:hypothetical protein SLEP1_g34258 [Rubroshorea leprosula]